MENRELELNIPNDDTKVENIDDNLAEVKENNEVVETVTEDIKSTENKTEEKTERPVRERRERPAREPRKRRVSAESTEENTEVETAGEKTERPVRERRERPVREPRERAPRKRRVSAESAEENSEGGIVEENTERPVRERRERPAREPRERTPRERRTSADGSEGEVEKPAREKRERPARGGRNKEPEIKLYVGSSPHLRSSEKVSNVMRDVVIALIPTLLAGIYFFGIRALFLTLVSVGSAVICEYGYQKFTKKSITINDYSAVITGMLLAFNVPVTLPYWMIAIGSAFAIIIVKQLYGGIGMNFMNPALAARAALMASFPAAMGSYVAPNAPALEGFIKSIFGGVDAGTYATIDVTTYATPLSNGQQVNLAQAIVGLRGGCIGEVSAICLIIGAAYLLYKGVIKLRIPVVFIGTTAVVLLLTGTSISDLPVQIFMGGLILGAFFMATDYVTAPVNRKAQVFFAMGCGIITALIRAYGGLPEGVSYSILFMNMLSPLLEKYCIPKVFGEGRATK